MLPTSVLIALDPLAAGPTDPALANDPSFAQLLARSYLQLVGDHLVPPGMKVQAAAVWLYGRAPFCLLAHNTASDPRFIYANRTAQACFEYDWKEFTQLLSRLSASPQDQVERQRLIEAVAQHGFATGYRGLRLAKSGRSFWIEDVTMWQVTDDDGVLRAQAAVYRRWRDA